MKKLSREDILKKCYKLYRDNYDYSFSVFNRNRDYVSIFCNTHQEFFVQRLADHLAGKGCRKCGYDSVVKKRSSNTLEFVEKAEIKRGTEKYSYEFVDYKNSKKKVNIVCTVHNQIFRVIPNNFLNGTGCPSCAVTGYKETEPGSLYILSHGDITKIGVTNGNPIDRCRDISKNSNKKFKVVAEYFFEDGKKPFDLEQNLLAILRKSYHSPICKFDGYTECFYDLPFELLLDNITALQGDLYVK